MKPLWVGLVDVEPEPGNEAAIPGVGAFVHVIAPADSAEDFRRAAEALFADAGFVVIHVDEDTEPWSDRLRYGHADRDIRELAERVAASGEPAFAEHWHAYVQRDE